MNEILNHIFKVVCSMSLSGSLLIAVILLIRPVIKNRLSRRWQYGIWLVAAARLLLPFTPQESLMGTLFQTGQTQDDFQLKEDHEFSENPGWSVFMSEPGMQEEEGYGKVQTVFLDAVNMLLTYLWLVWLGVALLLLMRKITVYQSFMNYLKAGREEVTDISQLDTLAQIGERAGVKRPVELYVNRLVSSPLLAGFLHPAIVLPDAELPEPDFSYTILHELMHYKQRDMFYKWLVQAVICIHWFNPLVWLMGQKMNQDCELACDEAVIQKLDAQQRRAYGNTLLHAAGAGRNCKNALASVMLTESAHLLIERMQAIMNYKKKSGLTMLLSAVLTASMVTGAAAAGTAAYGHTVPAENTDESFTFKSRGSTADETQNDVSSNTQQAEQYYKTDNLNAFGSVFAVMDKDSRKSWMKRFYRDKNTAFFAACLEELDQDSPLITAFAKTAYRNNNISFFKVLTGYMNQKALKNWLNQAEEDQKYSFVKVLRELLNDEWSEEDRKILAEYEKHGITKKGKSYYYNGKLIHVFLDIRKDSSFYRLEMNPKGSVNVKVTRDADGTIKSVGRMSDTQAEKLFYGEDY